MSTWLGLTLERLVIGLFLNNNEWYAVWEFTFMKDYRKHNESCLERDHNPIRVSAQMPEYQKWNFPLFSYMPSLWRIKLFLLRLCSWILNLRLSYHVSRSRYPLISGFKLSVEGSWSHVEPIRAFFNFAILWYASKSKVLFLEILHFLYFSVIMKCEIICIFYVFLLLRMII